MSLSILSDLCSGANSTQGDGACQLENHLSNDTNDSLVVHDNSLSWPPEITNGTEEEEDEDEDEEDRQSVASTTSNLSGLSDFSNFSGKEWKPCAGELMLYVTYLCNWCQIQYYEVCD